MNNNPELLTRKEAAQQLRICLSSLDKIINSKNFDGKIKIGRRVLIDKNKLNNYISNLYT